MASQENKPSSKLLWTIGPVCVGLTLLLTNAGSKTEPKKEVLSGALPEITKVEVPAPAAAPADTTAAPSAGY
ncbi:MAG: hypothetical protein ACK4WD_11300 [Flavobacteriales bacterium]|jgi:hypothetical protein